MGFFGDLAGAISKPFRGIGRIARGKFKQGLGDIGGGIKDLAPGLAFIPGVGSLAALGIGAAGGALSRGADKGFNLRNIVQGGAGGAGRAGTGIALKGIGSKLLSGIQGAGGVGGATGAGGYGGGAAATGTAGTVGAGGAGGVGTLAQRSVMPGIERLGGSITASAPLTSAASTAGNVASAAPSFASKAGGVLKGIGSWAKDHPDMLLDAAGNVISGNAEQDMFDRQMALREAQFAQQNDPRERAMRLLLSGVWRRA